MVAVIVEIEGATVRSELKAIEDGFEGENASVMNVNSKKL